MQAPELIYQADALPYQNGDKKRLAGPEAALPYFVQQYVQQHDQFILVIAKDMQQAYEIEQTAKFFLDDASAANIDILPDWETLPYDAFSPHEDIISQRLKVFSELENRERGALIIPVTTLIQRLPPASFVHANSLSLKLGQHFDLARYREGLENVGYRHVDTVYEHSEYAVRGSIMDVFPMGSDAPIRIELFDNEVESLRYFDPDTQRSTEKFTDISLLPANEFPWDRLARQSFVNRWIDNFNETSFACPLLRDVKDAIKPHGIEYYAPLFFDSQASIFEYLPDNTLCLVPSSFDTILETAWKDIEERYESRRYDIQRPILPPQKLYLKQDEVFSHLSNFPRLTGTKIEADAHLILHCSILPELGIDDAKDKPLADLEGQLSAFHGRTLIVAESVGRREVIADLLKEQQIQVEKVQDWQQFTASDAALCICAGNISSGFIDNVSLFQIISEANLYAQRVRQVRRRKKALDQNENMIKSLSELHVGSPVVHIDHGVGRYRGLETITVGDHVDEFLTLEYAGNAKLYVPISSLHLISRYSGTDESLAPLHKLGTDKWRTAKQKALEKIRDTAAELLEVYARREAKQGFQYEHPGQAYRTFCAQFPFEETPDQAQAINAVFQDMTRKQPMDRLVCGDVGFGKTEVAMRAAFIATHNGKQVAILVPTTLLAQQHYQSFQDRFADTPVKVEVLSRFKTGKEQTKALQQLEDGVIDIVVGTHKLIQGDIKFKNLGLLIIDEEHRFGVQQKEKLKAYRAEVDILALTATPIPRTLNMAMGGVRDLSIIATPPAKRLSIKTFIRQKEDALIREAVLREVLRGGQVYYLFNDVKHIEKEVAYLQSLIPESRVSFAHGQMRERDLEQAMSDFYHMRFNVLVCSTIIETGIDIPNANTIIINRSDMFGLAQLHQLRGRVGRSHHQAYAYLMTSAEKRLTKDAEKRLEAISSAQDLGAGFMLATHDLEIRGAGELLGEEQSGQIQSIGFTLYMELLEQAVSSLQAGKALSLEQSHHGAEINLRISALIPDDYLPDVHGRLVLYKRIASASHQDALKDIQVEMIDRFGLLPNPVKNLFKQTELKLLCESLGIEKIDAGASSGHLEFSSDTKVDPLAVVTLVQKRPDLYKLEGATKLRFEFNAIEADEKIMEIKSLLDKLIKA